MATPAEWFSAARPRTLPAALAPVGVGVGVAAGTNGVSVWRAVGCFVVALAIQVATNYANDYSDGVRGTDAARVGPARLTATGLASASSVKRAALAAFGVAAVVGAVLALTRSPWLLLVGGACIVAGWTYTGGPHPYGYVGLGEVAVFVFFGVVAVTGTVIVVSGRLPALGVLASLPVGLIAVALLVVNNLRDIPTDADTGKRTLAVRLGDRRTRQLYAGCVTAPFLLVVAIAMVKPLAFVALVAVVFSVLPLRLVMRGATGRELVAALVMTGTLQLVFGTLLAIGVAT